VLLQEFVVRNQIAFANIVRKLQNRFNPAASANRHGYLADADRVIACNVYRPWSPFARELVENLVHIVNVAQRQPESPLVIFIHWMTCQMNNVALQHALRKPLYKTIFLPRSVHSKKAKHMNVNLLAKQRECLLCVHF